ncbi:MAG TPA: 3-hydroxyacyl-ACP dehydratase FabZ [Dongiaceae bacterium]|jgi:3-hydroxyacyl-[acyl-carrier-protein] dehydratase
MTEASAERGIDIDAKGVMKMIPHRYPFLMIDRVENAVADQGCVGIKNVSMNEAIFQGHFPSDPVLPGVLIIEAMAQTAAVLVVHTLGEAFHGKLVYFMSVDHARFRRPVVPGDQLRLEVKKDRNRGPVWKFSGIAKVGGQVVAEADFAAMIRDA